MSIFIMPEDIRPILSLAHKYFRALVFSGAREGIGFILRSMFYTNLDKVYVVGDYVCKTFEYYVGIPRICIIDMKTLRNSFSEHVRSDFFDMTLRCRNPPGTITNECLRAISQGYDSGLRVLIYVEGEEDLLGLGIMMVVRNGYLIYGIPRKGVAVMPIEENIVNAINLFSKFKPM